MYFRACFSDLRRTLRQKGGILEYTGSMYYRLTLILLLTIFIACSPAEVTEKPNIILVFMDDMGYGDLECYGHPLIKTPVLNKLADDGIRFTSFYAPASVCTPSRAGLLTGRYPVRHAPFNFGPESTNGLPLSETTIADLLGQAGYRTGAIGKWHLGHQPEFLPTERGFDSFYGLPYSNDMILPWCPWLTEEDKLMLYQDAKPVREIGKNQRDLTLNYTEKAVSFIKEDSEKPFFLYLAHSMPHLPIDVADDFKGKSTAGLYGDVIEMIDWSMGQLKQTLEEEGQWENTLIIFTSDNGPWHHLPDRMVQDGVERWHSGSTGMLRGAKATTYEGGFRVPAVISWPGVIVGSRVSHELVTALDLFPTLAEIGGVRIPDSLQIDGFSLIPHFRGKESPRNSFFYGNLDVVEAVRKDEWKLRITETDSIQLFNLHQDPGEMYNRAAKFPEKVLALQIALKQFAEQTGAKTYAF